MKACRLLLLVLVLCGCTSVPEGIEPVKHFSLQRYLGKWYEIARLDHSFERGLQRITAEYSMRDDGGVKVLNRGFNVEQKQWDQADGRAYFVGDENVGHLKVSFFGPFYASYVVFELDEEHYQYALVTGPDRDYLWILSRTANMPEATLNKLLKVAKEKGFDTSKLIYVEHQ